MSYSDFTFWLYNLCIITILYKSKSLWSSFCLVFEWGSADIVIINSIYSVVIRIKHKKG